MTTISAYYEANLIRPPSPPGTYSDCETTGAGSSAAKFVTIFLYVLTVELPFRHGEKE